MKRLQKIATKRSLAMIDPEKSPSSSTIQRHKKRKPDNPWLEVPSFDGKEKEAMKDKMVQLRKLSRAGKVDHGAMKSLMRDTYPLRRQTILAGTDTVDTIIKSFPALIQPAHVSFLTLYTGQLFTILSSNSQSYRFNRMVGWSMVPI